MRTCHGLGDPDCGRGRKVEMSERICRYTTLTLMRDMMLLQRVPVDLDLTNGVLWWVPRPGELGWLSTGVYSEQHGVWRLFVCTQETELSLATMEALGIEDHEKGSSASCWPHRHKMEFSFVPSEFDQTKARWFVERILEKEAAVTAFPEFLEPAYLEDSYFWTREAHTVMPD